MTCYRDTTFCAAHCGNVGCERNQVHIPDQVPHDVPLLMRWADFSPECENYQSLEMQWRGD